MNTYRQPKLSIIIMTLLNDLMFCATGLQCNLQYFSHGHDFHHQLARFVRPRTRGKAFASSFVLLVEPGCKGTRPSWVSFSLLLVFSELLDAIPSPSLLCTPVQCDRQHTWMINQSLVESGWVVVAAWVNWLVERGEWVEKGLTSSIDVCWDVAFAHEWISSSVSWRERMF